MRYGDLRIKHKLYTDDEGESQVKFFIDADAKFWREDGTLSFLEVLADDPESGMIKLGDGTYYEPKNEYFPGA